MQFSKYLMFLGITIAISLNSCNSQKNGKIEFKKGLTEYTSNPISVGVRSPRFSWIVSSSERGQKQSAFQIFVSDSEKGLKKEKYNMWDSGKQSTNATLHHKYRGKTLESNKTYYWQVKIWDRNGKEAVSPVYTFSTTLLSPNDWQAKWIGANSAIEPKQTKGFFMDRNEEKGLKDTVSHNGRSVLLRNEILIKKTVKSAKVYVTGLGFYEMMLNGERVGSFVLAPAKTPYHKHILYDTYDVTKYLQKGDNAIGIHLGNGWYDPYKKWWKEYRMQWFGYKKALMQMHVTYKDGSSETFTTNSSWKTARGPVLYNCVYDGEIYDANEEIADWSKPGFDDNKWDSVTLMDTPKAELFSQMMPAIEITEIRIPTKTEPKPGMMVFDMKQNFTGWVRVALKGKKGTKVKIRFSEELYDDGTLNYTCNERAKATVEYTMKGGETEYYEPKFTYFGFQFVEITAEPELPVIESIEGRVVHSAIPAIGSFECSHELINKLHKATVWSQRSNTLSYPMDCPQRDERLGWFGDAQVTAEEAMFNFDMAMHYTNWLRGIKANQDEATGDIPIISPRPYIKDDGVEWSSSYITIAWNYYKYYGDTQLLEENYDAMKRYLEFLDDISDNYIVPKGWIGDWGSMVEGWKEGEPKSIPTAFYYFNSTILAKIAKVLGKPDDEKHFSQLAENIKEAYNKEFFDKKTNDYNDGSQMANAFPIYLNLVPEEHKQAVFNNLVHDIVENNNTHLTTGVLGTKYMIDALTVADRSDVAWALATQTTYPSWAEMMKRFNTVCEFWTLKQSHNHVMMGSIDAWFYKTLTGINLHEDKPAYKVFTIKPFMAEGLTYAKASTETFRGTISSNWKRTENSFELSVSVPFNTKAIVYIPAKQEAIINESNASIEGGKGVTFIKYEKGYQIFEVVSGDYIFSY
jgi:alpha-L-rhamnosidase